jgi:sugar/nucleoside kinase (ribokinase family)
VTPDLVLLGNLLVDDVVFADGRTRMAQPGGAMLYASLAATLWSTRVGCVSLCGDDYPASALAALRARDVRLEGVHPLHTNGVRTWLLYEGSVRRVVHRLGCPTHEAVSPEPSHVPEAWRTARAFHLAPMPFATQRALVRAIRGWESPAAPAFISVDPHMPVRPDTRSAWSELLADVDAFFPSDDEWMLPEVTRDPAAVMTMLAAGRLRFIAYKRGAAGGCLYDTRERQVHTWPVRVGRAQDPTGAGDAFMAGFVTAHLEGSTVEQCLRRAVVTAGFAVEGWGPDGLLAATRAAAEVRLAEWDRTEVRS